MHRPSGFRRYAALGLAAVLLGACGSQREPAQKALGEIEGALMATSEDAAKYAPAQLSDVRTRLAALEASFDRQDYAAVLAGAPPVLRAATDLSAAAAQKKADVMKGLDAAWTRMSVAVPGYLAAIERRIDDLSGTSTRNAAAHGAQHIDIGAARSSLREAASLWSKATAAFANGNMQQAVSTAEDVQSRLTALAATLKMDLPAPGAG